MSQVAFAGAAGLALVLGGALAMAVAMFMLMLAPLPTVAAGLEVLLAFTGAGAPATPVSACVLLLLAELIGAVALAPRPADITP